MSSAAKKVKKGLKKLNKGVKKVVNPRKIFDPLNLGGKLKSALNPSLPSLDMGQFGNDMGFTPTIPQLTGATLANRAGAAFNPGANVGRGIAPGQ